MKWHREQKRGRARTPCQASESGCPDLNRGPLRPNAARNQAAPQPVHAPTDPPWGSSAPDYRGPHRPASLLPLDDGAAVPARSVLPRRASSPCPARRRLRRPGPPSASPSRPPSCPSRPRGPLRLRRGCDRSARRASRRASRTPLRGSSIPTLVGTSSTLVCPSMSDPPCRRRGRCARLLLLVQLVVPGPPDQRFKQVFDREQAGDTAVLLVDHHCHGAWRCLRMSARALSTLEGSPRGAGRAGAPCGEISSGLGSVVSRA